MEGRDDGHLGVEKMSDEELGRVRRGGCSLLRGPGISHRSERAYRRGRVFRGRSDEAGVLPGLVRGR